MGRRKATGICSFNRRSIDAIRVLDLDPGADRVSARPPFRVLVGEAPEEPRPVALVTDFEVPEAWYEGTTEAAVIAAIVKFTTQAMAKAGIDAALASWGLLHRRHGLSMLRPRWPEPYAWLSPERAARVSVEIEWTGAVGDQVLEDVLVRFGPCGWGLIEYGRALGMEWTRNFDPTLVDD